MVGRWEWLTPPPIPVPVGGVVRLPPSQPLPVFLGAGCFLVQNLLRCFRHRRYFLGGQCCCVVRCRDLSPPGFLARPPPPPAVSGSRLGRGGWCLAAGATPRTTSCTGNQAMLHMASQPPEAFQSPPPTEGSLAGTQVTIKPEAEVRTALRHTHLEAAMRVPFCGKTGSVLRYDSDDNNGCPIFPLLYFITPFPASGTRKHATQPQSSKNSLLLDPVCSIIFDFFDYAFFREAEKSPKNS